MIQELIITHGSDILRSPGMEYEKTQYHHAKVCCFDHSVAVAYVSVRLALLLNLRVDIRSMIRGALLHDYFLYDWRDGMHRPHAFKHAQVALQNAGRDFEINALERDIIERHMFPVNLRPPRSREGKLVNLADKLCAVLEATASLIPIRIPGGSIRGQVI